MAPPVLLRQADTPSLSGSVTVQRTAPQLSAMASPMELRAVVAVVDLDEPHHREWSRRPGSASLNLAHARVDPSDLAARAPRAVVPGSSICIEQKRTMAPRQPCASPWTAAMLELNTTAYTQQST
ncbi:hypothetical protein ZWY2020_051029 [Hordeum vulgare]|nr:hypothetical protein ZWY2020_051029 [Hordeum vulgare]